MAKPVVEVDERPESFIIWLKEYTAKMNEVVRKINAKEDLTEEDESIVILSYPLFKGWDHEC